MRILQQENALSERFLKRKRDRSPYEVDFL